jgi:hypothetical protein
VRAAKTLENIISKIKLLARLFRSRGSSQYSDYATGWTTGFWFPVEAVVFSARHRIRTGPGAYSASSTVSTGGSSPEVVRLVREADQSPLSSAEVKNAWGYTSTPPYIFKQRDKFLPTFSWWDSEK